MRWVLVLWLLASSAGASELWALRGSAAVLQGVDWLQTLEIVKDDRWTESNPLLGQEPSEREVNRYFLLTSIILVQFCLLLPAKYERDFLALVVFGFGVNVVSNYSVGIRVNF